VTFVFLACARSETVLPPTQTETPARPETSAPPAPAAERNVERDVERNIYIDSVDIANPIIITGRGRTFENNVALRVRDARGALITETFTTSIGEIGHHNRYRGAIWVTRDPGDRVTVEAFEYSAKDGSEQGLQSGTRPYEVERIDAQLYFPDADCTAVKPYVRRLPKSISHARLLVEALVAGPLDSERGAVAAFPEGSRVESVILRDGVLTVDFNHRLRNAGGACRAQMIRESVTKTLQSLPSVRKVVITADKSEELALQP
jgi:hypothetical protein